MCRPASSVAAALVVVCLPSLAIAATIRGAVTDPSRAGMVGAQVTIKDEDTGATRTSATDAAGLFSFIDLAVGRYVIQVAAAGFKTSVIRGVRLDVADVRAVDLELAIGEVAEHVAVEVAALTVKTMGGEVAGLVAGEQARELPLNGRNFLQLALLMPGVSAPDALNLTDKGMLSLVTLSVSGGPANANMFTVDGVNSNDVGSNNSIVITPSVDAIEEFKVHRNSYGAEYGQAAGAQVDIVTRAGTNRFQASAYYFGRNEALDGTNYFLAQAGKAKEKLRYHDFGFTLGGPIVKDRIHVFVSEEWNRSLRGTVRTSFVPTDAERVGDFSGPPGCGQPVPIDPFTGEPFPDNRIPSDRLSPGGLLLASLYSRANTIPQDGTCNNWVESVDTPTRWRQDSVRADWRLAERARLLLRFTQDGWRNGPPSDTERMWGSDPFPVVDSSWDQSGRSLVAQLSHDLGTVAVNTLQLSWTGNQVDIATDPAAAPLVAQINSAIPTVFPAASKYGGLEHSHPAYGGLASPSPWRNRMDLFVIKDDYTRTWGRHLLKAGALFSYNRKNEVAFGTDEAPQFGPAIGIGTLGTTTNPTADLLLKDMTFHYTERSANPYVQLRWQDLEAYVSDSWRVRPGITLDAGVRVSYLGNPYATDDAIANFDPAAFDPALGADPCNGLREVPGSDACHAAGFLGGSAGPNRSLVESRLIAAPRLGAAWDVFGNGKTAVRAGLGQFFIREVGSSLAFAANPPFASFLGGQRALDTNASPCDGCLGTETGSPSWGREARALVPHNWHWNLTFEQLLWSETILELSYVGNRGVHMSRIVDVNMVPPGDANGNGTPDRLEYVRSGADRAAAAALRPFGVFGDKSIPIATNGGSSIYHGLQTQMRGRFGRGSQWQASYTFSRVIADNTLDGSFEVASDPAEPGRDRGLPPFSRQHLFNGSVVLMLPALEARSGFVRRVLGNWEAGAVVVATSGPPLTIVNGWVAGISGVSGTGAFNERPNRVAGEPCRAGGDAKLQWLNPRAFTLDGFELGTLGNSGRGVCEGPGLLQVDLALYKNIPLGNRVRAQLRFEVFNVLDRDQFLAVNTALNASVLLDAPLASATRVTESEVSPSFGQVTRARDPRQVQLGLKVMF